MIDWLWKRVKLFFKLWWAKRQKDYKPIVALLFLTSRCNMSCLYCFAEHKGEFKDLSLGQWKEIINGLRERGCELIFLMGGEPLLYEGFGELIDYIKSKGMQCHLTTNGILIPKYVEELKKVDLLMVSLDGDKKGNDANRGKETFKKILRGIECAKAHNIPLRINSVMSKNNVNDIEWLLNYGKGLGAYVGFTIPARSKNPGGVKDMLLTDEEIKNFHLKLLYLKELGEKITLSKKSLMHVLGYKKSYNELIFRNESLANNYPEECCYGRYIVFIDSRGSIYPCTTLWEMSEVYEPKNIFERGWDEALRNAQYLPCHVCYCAGGIEWSYMSSFKGIIHALKFTLSQTRGK